MDLEQRIAKIQRSTRTTIPYFVPAHNNLRMRFKWYYKWHLHPLASFLHLSILLIFTAAWVWGIYTEYTPDIAATPPANITITEKAQWQAQTYDNEIIDTETVPGAVKLLQGKDGYSSGYFGSCTGNNSTGQINSWDSLYFQFPLQVSNFPANVSSARLWLYANHGFWNSAEAVPPDPRYVQYQINGIGNDWVENPMTCTPSGNAYSKTGTIDMSLYSQCYGPWGETPDGPCMGDFWPNTYIPFELDGGTPAEVAQKWAGWGMRAQITHLDGLNINLREYDNHPPKLEINFANGETWNVNLPVQSGAKSGTILSAPTQIDGGADFTSWDTFTSSATIPANTSINYRFRTSSDALTWGNWTASTPFSASIDLATLLGETDKIKRYLQVEVTLANTDGTSTPVLNSYTANITNPICPAGTTQNNGNLVLNTTGQWNAGTNLNTLTNNDVVKISNIAGKLDLQSLYNSDNSSVSTIMDWAVETGNKANPLDGNLGTFWGFSGPSPASTGNDDGNNFANAYWLMDLKQPYDLTQMRMYMNNDPDWPTEYSFQFAVSSNGVDYTDIITTAEAQTHQQWHSFDISAQARYVRLHIDAGGWMSFRNLAEIELYGKARALHTSAATQLDGTADLAAWTTFAPVATIPANTTLSYRFRTSDDASNWGSWTSSTGNAASIDLATLLSETDIAYRYLQVESTLTNTDGTSTPTLSSYTANYIVCTPDEPPAPTCEDGDQNGDETGVDCGGSCGACTPDEPDPTCDDGAKNGDETGVDCGGSCGACTPDEPDSTCNDGIQNQGEEKTDCGGPCAACPVEPTCNDGVKNGDETGVDCGGSCGACTKPETCSDGIKNQNEEKVDCGGICGACPKTCLAECQATALESFSQCQDQNIFNGGNYSECADKYCEAVHACFDKCGGGDATEEYTFVVTPNGGESNYVSDSIPVRWYYTARDKKTKVQHNNVPVKMSLSIDGGATYTPIRVLIPGNNTTSPLVRQFRYDNQDLEIGNYQLKANSSYEYNWIPNNPAYATKRARIKLEPFIYNCVVRYWDDTSDNNFELKTAANPQQITLSVTPTLITAKPGGEASYEISASLNDGTDVTSSTTFSYLVTDVATIGDSNDNTVTLIAGETPGLYDRALQITGKYQGLSAITYASLEITKDDGEGGGSTDYTVPTDCGTLCQVADKFKDIFRGVKGSGSTSSASAAALFAGLIAAANVFLNTLSLFKQVIAPLLKGKEKKRQQSVVYDAITGLPVTGVKVMLMNSQLGTLASLSVSDKDGKYSLELSPGKSYSVKIEKDNYIQYIGGRNQIEEQGLLYEDSYLGGEFQTTENEYIFRRNIPVLEIETELSATELLRRNRIRTLLIALNISLLLLGSGLAIVIFVYYPTTVNYVILALYILILFYHLINRFVVNGRSFGEVKNVSDNRLVDLAIIRAVNTQDNKLAKTVVSDVKGRFTLLLPKGKYRIFANKEGLQQLDKIEAEIKTSFKPREDHIRMDKAPVLNDIAPAQVPAHNMQVNDVGEIIERYEKL